MKREEFLKLVTSILKRYGFSKKGNNYYLDFSNEGFLGVFGLQKSSYDAYYYVEFGLAIKNSNPKMPFPKYNEVNLNFGRIKFDFDVNATAVYYENLNEERFEEILKQNIERFIETVKLGKKSVQRNFFEIGRYAIGQSSLAYLGLPPDSKLVIPETVWHNS